MNLKQYTSVIMLMAVTTGCGESLTGGEGSLSGGGGQSGSMARFAVKGDYLYAVDNSRLMMFDISDADRPAYLSGKDQFLNFGVETIFPSDTLLFLGSRTGMYIYDITRPGFPQQKAYVSHVTSCDPVVAAGNYAYVTLNSASAGCGRMVNELHVYDLSDIEHPVLVNTVFGLYGPKGLGVFGKKLFVCDNGLKVFDISLPDKPVWIDDLTHLPEISGIDTYDVIPLENGILLLTGADGFYQFDITGEKLSLLSKISVSPGKQ